ncbi:MAG: hypothetical protein U0798_00755 [Gemmataceae bacterium]
MDEPLAIARKVALYAGFAAIVAAQWLIAVSVLGGRDAIVDSRPIVSGRHPLHLVHGSLGACTFRERGTTSCYDPTFQAGYPKTPVFDGGCRPAELILYLASYFPHSSETPGLVREIVAYKVGLVGICLLVPFVFAASARGCGAGGSGTVLAALFGTLLWWSPPLRTMFNAGEIDLMLAGLCGVAFGGALSAYHRSPGPRTWIIGATLAIAGWYAHPVIWVTFTPVAAIFYLSLAPRHGLAWHLGLFGASIAGFIPNLWWLQDWGRFWWLRRPPAEVLSSLPSAGEVAVASGWETLLDWSVTGWPLLITAAICCHGMMAMRARTPAWLLLGAAAGTLLVARLGQVWPAMANVRTERAAMLAVAISTLPVAYTLGAWWDRAKIGMLLVLAAALVPLVLILTPISIPRLTVDRSPLPLGLTAEQEQLVNVLRDKTDPTARILLDETAFPESVGWNWTALLPRLTERSFLGGLESEACIEPLVCSLRSSSLHQQTDQTQAARDLEAFARRYNIGWVACRPESAEHWLSIPGAAEIARIPGTNELVLIRFGHPHSFITHGKGTWEEANRKRIVLTNVEPDANGIVSLSLHFQEGMRLTPPSVTIEPEKDPFDPTPMIRLRMPGPTSRVTIVWQNH